MLQLFQPRETSEQEHLLGHPNPLEDRAQLARAELGRPATGEIGQVPADLAERGAIAAIVAAWPAETDAATVKDLSDDRGDFANPVILGVIAKRHLPGRDTRSQSAARGGAQRDFQRSTWTSGCHSVP